MIYIFIPFIKLFLCEDEICGSKFLWFVWSEQKSMKEKVGGFQCFVFDKCDLKIWIFITTYFIQKEFSSSLLCLSCIYPYQSWLSIHNMMEWNFPFLGFHIKIFQPSRKRKTLFFEVTDHYKKVCFDIILNKWSLRVHLKFSADHSFFIPYVEWDFWQLMERAWAKS